MNSEFGIRNSELRPTRTAIDAKGEEHRNTTKTSLRFGNGGGRAGIQNSELKIQNSGPEAP
jgi:hypothetical protein